MSDSDSATGSEDGWEVEYRRSLDDDLSEDDQDSDYSDYHGEDADRSRPQLSAHPPTSTLDTAVDTAGVSASLNSDVAGPQTHADSSAGSHVLQALDELWAQLGEQRMGNARWPQHLWASDALKKPTTSHLPTAPPAGSDTLYSRMQQERQRDTYGDLFPLSTPFVSEHWLVCQLLLLYQRLDSQHHSHSTQPTQTPLPVNRYLTHPCAASVCLIDSLYVWDSERQQYELKQLVCTPHLSPSAVESLTRSTAHHASLLSHIHTFVSRHCHYSSTINHCLQAFGHSLHAYLHTHDSQVWQFENDVHAAADERLSSVLSLSAHMAPHTQYVRMLHHVIQQFVTQPAGVSSVVEESSRLLSILYAEYEAQSLLTDTTLAALSLCLLLDTLVPYVELLDEVRTYHHTTCMGHSTLRHRFLTSRYSVFSLTVDCYGPD